MSFLLKATLFLLFFCHIQPEKVLTKVLLDDPEALCLDGSPGVYYVHKGSSSKFLLNFEGGGWCGSHLGIDETVENCYRRTKQFLGSSNFDSPNKSYTQGVMSDHSLNIFKDWTVVLMRYCDGAGHQGYKKKPVQYQGKKIYFKGHNVTIGQLDSLDKKYQMFSKATEIVVTGYSAGGLATFMWANYIKSRAPKQAKVWAIPDSGIFLDSENYITHKPHYKTRLINLLSISNAQVDLPTEQCIALNPIKKWKCMFAANLYQHVKVPLFVVNSLYDSWSLSYLLQMQCNYYSSFSGCDTERRQYIEDYRRNTSLILQKIGGISKNGVWAPACSNHVYMLSDFFYSGNFRIPARSRNSLSFAIQKWMWGAAGSHIYMDKVSWPDNAPCSGLRLLTKN